MGLDQNIYDSKKQELAYFRKVNQLRGYMVNVLGMAADADCEYFKITRADLEDILDRAERIKSNPKLAEELLPTEPGFFFGSYDYDEYYLEENDLIISDLRTILKNHPRSKVFYYYDWW